MYRIIKNQFPWFNHVHDCSVTIAPENGSNKWGCWESYQPEEKGEMYLKVSGCYRATIKYCPFCGYSSPDIKFCESCDKNTKQISIKPNKCESVDSHFGPYPWLCYEDEDTLKVSANNGDYLISVHFCPFCGYTINKNKELIEKYRPTLEKLSKE